ncbi:MAG TPA: protein translocase subunit SecF, partial [Bacteroidota bacterium]|nr:protein translocase subunit SecF [Bacteroidota bacterium]
MRLFKATNIDFMGKRKVWYTISGLTLVIGLIGIIFKGMTFGIDFLGGTEILVRFSQPVEINEVRAAMDKIGFSRSEIKTFGDPKDILLRTPLQAEGNTIGDRIRSGLSAQFENNKF